MTFEETQMLIQDRIPADSKVIGHNWLKSNKDGSRDRRYSNNSQIPLVRYGEIIIGSTSGLQEKYLFSNFEVAYEFYKSFNDYQSELKNMGIAPLPKDSLTQENPNVSGLAKP